MIDHLGRTIHYLRISVTDRCNLRCRYCMPPDGIQSVPMPAILTYEEIRVIAEEAANLGIRHIRLTGGEPLVRRGAADLVRTLKKVPGIETVTLTTNGVLLQEQLPGLLQAGLDAVNISLDTLDRTTYREITGADQAQTVLQSIRAACAARTAGGTPLRVKVNAVSIDLGEDNLRDLIGLAEELPVDVRFIEMMPIGFGKQFRHPGNPCGSRGNFANRGGRYAVISHRDLADQLQAMYPEMREDHTQHGYGPAVYYTIPGFTGSVGLISAIHGKFCDACNRVRLTSQGFLKTCLCYNEGADLRSVLRTGLPDREMRTLLRDRMEEAIFNKPDAHCFESPDRITESAGMSAIGG